MVADHNHGQALPVASDAFNYSSLEPSCPPLEGPTTLHMRSSTSRCLSPNTFLWQGQFGAEEGRGMDGQNQNQKCAKGRGIWEGGRKRREEGREHRGRGDCRYWLRSCCGGRGVSKRSNNQRATDQVVSPVRKHMLTHMSELTEKGYWEEGGDLT